MLDVFDASTASGSVITRVELGEDLGLDGLVFDHRLDDELTVGQVGEAGGELQPRERSVAIVVAELALGRRTLQRLGEAVPTRGHQLVRRLVDDDVRAGLGRYLGDARTHLPGADHADPFDLFRAQVFFS